MKYLFILVIVMAIAGFAANYFHLTKSISIKLPAGSITSSKNNPAVSTPTSSTTYFVPAGFKGPTGQPHVNGPSGPPPNY